MKNKTKSGRCPVAAGSAFSDLASLWIWSYEQELTSNAMWAVTKFAKMCDGSLMSRKAANWLKDGRSARKTRERLFSKPNAKAEPRP